MTDFVKLSYIIILHDKVKASKTGEQMLARYTRKQTNFHYI